LGFKSRSTLYRLKDAELSRYLRPPARAGGAQMLELEPIGLPSLRDWMNTILQSQAKTAALPPANLPALAFGAPSPAPSAEPVDPATVAQGLATLVANLPEDAIPNLATSRERREHYRAELARLEALQKRGDLVGKAETMGAAFACVRETRDMLLGIPPRLAPQLMGCSTTQAAYEMLDKEIRHSLHYLAKSLGTNEDA
jgi:hypothetical protein